VYNETLAAPHRSVLTPHAPYSISPKTFAALNQATKNQVISIHNQEHPAENELYKSGGGDYLKLFSIFNIHQSPSRLPEKAVFNPICLILAMVRKFSWCIILLLAKTIFFLRTSMQISIN
jgi:hypothetical protein